MASTTVGFCGLGAMGARMAANLVRAGFPVRVWNRTPEKTAPLREIGATPCSAPADTALGAKAVVTMLWDGRAVDEVIFGPRGVVSGAAAGTIVIDMSTTSPVHARECSERLESHGLRFLDAPVTGALSRVEAGTMAVMVGGDPGTLADVSDVLLAMAASATLIGPVGSGQLVKMANQVIGFGTLLALCEGMAIAAGGGADLARALEVFVNGTARSDLMAIYGPLIARGELTGPIRPGLALKDLKAARETADRLGSRTPVTALVIDLFEQMIARGEGDLGCHAVYAQLAEAATD